METFVAHYHAASQNTEVVLVEGLMVNTNTWQTLNRPGFPAELQSGSAG